MDNRDKLKRIELEIEKYTQYLKDLKKEAAYLRKIIETQEKTTVIKWNCKSKFNYDKQELYDTLLKITKNIYGNNSFAENAAKCLYIVSQQLRDISNRIFKNFNVKFVGKEPRGCSIPENIDILLDNPDLVKSFVSHYKDTIFWDIDKMSKSGRYKYDKLPWIKE